MQKKKVSSKRPTKKAHSSSRLAAATSNVERTKSSKSLESGKQHSQRGFSEPGSNRRENVNYNDVMIGIP